MGLREVLEEEIDDERFDAIFEALFGERAIELDTEFVDREFDKAYVKYPLLARLADRIDEFVVERREEGLSEEIIYGMLMSKAMGCISIAAFADSEVDDSL